MSVSRWKLFEIFSLRYIFSYYSLGISKISDKRWKIIELIEIKLIFIFRFFLPRASSLYPKACSFVLKSRNLEIQIRARCSKTEKLQEKQVI